MQNRGDDGARKAEKYAGHLVFALRNGYGGKET